jgi:hypothetical protein
LLQLLRTIFQSSSIIHLQDEGRDKTSSCQRCIRSVWELEA